MTDAMPASRPQRVVAGTLAGWFESLSAARAVVAAAFNELEIILHTHQRAGIAGEHRDRQRAEYSVTARRSRPSSTRPLAVAAAYAEQRRTPPELVNVAA
jgi:hypothetical protein